MKKLVILIALLLMGCSAQETVEVKTEAMVPVVISPATRGTIVKEMQYVGQITPSESISVSSKMAGKVKETFFDVGDRVEKDDVLFALDEKDIEDQLLQLDVQIRQAELGIKNAETSLSTVTGGQFEAQLLQQEISIQNAEKQIENSEIAISNAKIAVENAQLQLDNVTETYNSTSILYKAGTIARNEFEKAQLAYNQCLAALDQAKNTYSQALLGKDQAQQALAKARESYELTSGQIAQENTEKAALGVSSAEVTKDILLVQREVLTKTLTDTSVKSPISGTVGVRNAKPGEFTSNQAPAFVIVDLDTVNVEVKVSELLINRINAGDKVELIVRAADSEKFEGTITTVNPIADQTGAFPVKIRIQNSLGKLKPGMFAEVRFIREESGNAIILPRNTVMDSQNGSYVYANDNGFAKRLFVTTGIDNGTEIEILSGITEGDQIITTGQSFLNEGDKLDIVEGE